MKEQLQKAKDQLDKRFIKSSDNWLYILEMKWSWAILPSSGCLNR